MLIRISRIAFAIIMINAILSYGTLLYATQRSNKPQKHGAPPAARQSPQSAATKSGTAVALEILVRLRALRDCWSDTYMVLVNDDPSFENDSLYLRCSTNYQLRLVEAKEAVRQSSTISNLTLRREIRAAMQVFNDLDAVYSLFESRAYFFSRLVQVSDIYTIVSKYNIPYQGASIAKTTVYRALLPARRTHIDQLAALIRNAPPDNNPTLTPEQAAAAADDLDWSIVERRGIGYDWYLRRHPKGLHSGEALKAIKRLDATRSKPLSRITTSNDELIIKVRETIQAFVQGNKAAFERLLAPEFPNRAGYIAQLLPQSEALSFEIINLTIQPVPQQPKDVQAHVRVLYRGTGARQRTYYGRITYTKRYGYWQIIEWLSP
jgi:hypothetical protein